MLVSRVTPRTVITWTWVLRRGSRTQNSTEGPKFGPRANGASSKIFESQDYEAQIELDKDQEGLSR